MLITCWHAGQVMRTAAPSTVAVAVTSSPHASHSTRTQEVCHSGGRNGTGVAISRKMMSIAIA
jgi:hypothetical protein